MDTGGEREGDQSEDVGPRSFAGMVEITFADLGELWKYNPHWKWPLKIRRRPSTSTEYNFWHRLRESHPK